MCVCVCVVLLLHISVHLTLSSGRTYVLIIKNRLFYKGIAS